MRQAATTVLIMAIELGFETVIAYLDQHAWCVEERSTVLLDSEGEPTGEIHKYFIVEYRKLKECLLKDPKARMTHF